MTCSTAASTDAIQAVCLLCFSAGVLSAEKVHLLIDARNDFDQSLKYFERRGQLQLDNSEAAAGSGDLQAELSHLAAEAEHDGSISSKRESELARQLVGSVSNRFVQRLCLAWAQTIARTAGSFEFEEFQYVASL